MKAVQTNVIVYEIKTTSQDANKLFLKVKFDRYIRESFSINKKITQMEEDSNENPTYIVEDAAETVHENISIELKNKFSITEIIEILDIIGESMEKIGLIEDEKLVTPIQTNVERSIEVNEDVLANYVIAGCKEKNIALSFEELDEIYAAEMIYYKELGLLMDDDLDLSNAFQIILSNDNFSSYINEIASLLCDNDLTRESLNEILKENKIKNVNQIKEELLDLILKYVNIILNDFILSQKELSNIRFLKNIFSIKEGDFYNYRYDEVEEILHRQLSKIYEDNIVDDLEALHKVDLQELFSLSYDQFLEFVNVLDSEAIMQNANLKDLETVFNRVDVEFNVDINIASRKLSSEVKKAVWNRDNGKCTKCGSREKLEYDHIIPFNKGGSNTTRNIELLCEVCNRKKSAKIE